MRCIVRRSGGLWKLEGGRVAGDATCGFARGGSEGIIICRGGMIGDNVQLGKE